MSQQMHKYSVGDGIHNGGNGDRYPYRVIAVSASGKTLTCRPMKYSATDEGRKIGVGHQEWLVEDYPEDEDVGTITVTWRKQTGRWAQKGQSSTSNFGTFAPGAIYSCNWEI